jgi:hypothetical protein
MKKCSKCKKTLANSKFYKGTNQQGLSSYCKECSHIRYKKVYKPKMQKMRTTLTHKQCRLCEEDLLIKNFSRFKDTYCMECRSYLGHVRTLSKYNLTVDQYVDMLKEQDSVCKICKQPDSKRLSVDHDHSCCSGTYSCGKCVRGLLCSYCNRTLGLAKDDPQILRTMAEYLESYQ